jgi:hypothetical protein
VKSNSTSKLTIISRGSTWREPKAWTNSIEYLTWCGELPVWLLSRPVKCFDKRQVGKPVVLTVGLNGTSDLWIFGNPQSLRGLEPCGYSFWQTSSAIGNFFR